MSETTGEAIESIGMYRNKVRSRRTQVRRRRSNLHGNASSTNRRAGPRTSAFHASPPIATALRPPAAHVR
jgi:hypothetical protein